ncbi:DNA binding domain protein, excisionase family (modular protein) [Candidatus Sulfotelmatomonas gaucii]|uniref:DNA binding domain protein, excisionase family (Modular protein) n=1 Tax=Candidatus Sulfuritelmatomonas gaucii TaxID=2043161 RepID=A0A2N9LBY5_9BACT|nr:DNA binding domain protein, excisionase family (modular protein) [Candidatus Sulfotelmatomonas gaucii]
MLRELKVEALNALSWSEIEFEKDQLGGGIPMCTTITPEPFVDATRAAKLLGIRPRRVLEMARAGQIPAYPLGTGARRTWRFRLSEICKAITARR